MDCIDPKKYELSTRVKLQYLEKDHIKIIIHRKSRIIMKDGLRILEIVKKITAVESRIKISLDINGPICSKTIKLLSDNGIPVYSKHS